MAGFFVTFEGIDKSGKTTQAELLAGKLREKGRDVVFTQEPGGTGLGREIRHLVLGWRPQAAVVPLAEMLLFAADRAQHVAEVIRPALEAGKIVISNRFVDSTIAYQGYGRGMDLVQLRAIQEVASDGLWPNLTVLVDIDVATSRERGGASDRLEAENDLFFERIREGYLALGRTEPNRIFRVEGRLSVEVVSQHIYAEVSNRLGLDNRL